MNTNVRRLAGFVFIFSQQSICAQELRENASPVVKVVIMSTTSRLRIRESPNMIRKEPCFYAIKQDRIPAASTYNIVSKIRSKVRYSLVKDNEREPFDARISMLGETHGHKVDLMIGRKEGGVSQVYIDGKHGTVPSVIELSIREWLRGVPSIHPEMRCTDFLA